ncbi:sugar ABC transporter substrate-binding protein [Sporosalibacterium faouarense]|uniref:sugar ABC transporter substrate-binding protein n=1 Tax=Sporosalibacterium faouarense TaxID=516123 RepID=UPI00141CE7BD|nr:substrate-binding domain-containing protein [Sporosalibacterium faouarense]MTI47133.1 sugar ABC transporter substrate-binding protein [Bacillota bacterium]
MNRNLLKRIITLSLFLILITLAVITYNDVKKLSSNQDDSIAVIDSNNNKIKVGFSLGTLKEERWIRDRDILVAKLIEFGADVLVQNANNDDEDQLKQVKYLISQNIDVLILVPNDYEKAKESVRIAKENGVKVISYDRLVLNSDVDLYISFDNEKVGELMASYLVKRIPRGNYLIINGAKSDNNTSMIKKGYDKVLSSKIKNKDINILKEEWSVNWMNEYAFRVTDELIQDNEEIDAIITGDDNLAGGVIKALSEHRMAGNVLVTGQDADLSACQRIVEGTQAMTVYKPIEKLAEATASFAIKLANNENVNVEKTIFDGSFDVPYCVLEPILVDKYNMDDTIIKDGFHLKNEVYKNFTD